MSESQWVEDEGGGTIHYEEAETPCLDKAGCVLMTVAVIAAGLATLIDTFSRLAAQ
jgi:hypothetical protein